MPGNIHIATIGKPHGIKGAMSIIAKTRPQAIIFSHPLFLEDGTSFDVSQFDTYHTKVVCWSLSVEDRTQAEKMRMRKLYCDRNSFFQNHPEQIFDDLCEGYQVLAEDGLQIGLIDHVEFINNIPFLIVTNDTQTLHLPANIQHIDHIHMTLQLNYQPL